MQINTTNNLPIITGFDRRPQQQSNASRESGQKRQSSSLPLQGQIVQSQLAPGSLYARSTRPPLNAQPMFNQQLTQSGEQARQTYQNIAQAGEAELANRLDVVV